METTASVPSTRPSLTTLPGDDIRQIMWGFADRFDIQMLVQSVRPVARGPVARLVAEGGRHTHDWTEGKNGLLTAFDAAGITALFADPEYGGFIEGPKNLALALAAFELAWVDGGAATCSLAGHLALAPIHEKGTEEQKRIYMTRAIPNGDREVSRGAFCLTEPLPFVGVDTRVLSGRVRVTEWKEGAEPRLQVEKRGRFITNMGFANFVTAAVESDDEKIKGTCMVILEETDPGTYDRGSATHKLVHQLSSTTDPIFNLEVPAHRIIGGYTVQDGVIVPNYNHSQIIEAVFRRTRVTVGLMTAAKLLSAVEPVIRYQRTRFRGGSADVPGSPRHDLGLQQKEDTLHRLVDVWAFGEAAAALGFATTRFFDDFDPIDHRRDEIFGEGGIPNGRAGLKALAQKKGPAIEFLRLKALPPGRRDEARFAELEKDDLVQFMIQDSLALVLCPAVKLWNTGQGANRMREAVSLMGGYGITEDCPGFLPQKWMDAQLEATYEGPEAVQRRQLSLTMTNDLFLTQFQQWTLELRRTAGTMPGTGACTVASAMELWGWTLRHLLTHTDADGNQLYRDQRQGVTFPMADALCWLLASRFQILSLVELVKKQKEGGAPEGIEGFVNFFTDLCHVQSANAAGEVAQICTSLVYGYNRHPSWELEGSCCHQAEDLETLEGIMPGITACAGSIGDVLERDGSHPPKAGPCVRFTGVEGFVARRNKLDGCLSGSRLAKDRAAQALTEVMIPEALDYPA